ncbi:MAG TPA: hydroxyethylthiazole kinase [Patescibacteria group bacterium]|nr:hydroxyethylthiazole kinase [Patescibacteria group bacterium]
MKKIKLDAYSLLEKIRKTGPVVHHLTNWVTIYDCANIVKVMGGSPVMAHASQEVAQMAGIASSLVLNIGTLTVEFVEAMKIAARSANRKGIPVILDACGAGATRLRDEKCFQLLAAAKIDVIKGNASEVARISGEKVRTKGVDAGMVGEDLMTIASRLARRRRCTVVVTGKEDIVTDGKTHYLIRNGHPMMAHVVGTGCMAASAIGAFAAVEKDTAYAASCALVCFELAAECAAASSAGPGTFKEKIFDCIFALDKKTIDTKQKVVC